MQQPINLVREGLTKFTDEIITRDIYARTRLSLTLIASNDFLSTLVLGHGTPTNQNSSISLILHV
jgi:hypothetical protein